MGAPPRRRAAAKPARCDRVALLGVRLRPSRRAALRRARPVRPASHGDSGDRTAARDGLPVAARGLAGRGVGPYPARCADRRHAQSERGDRDGRLPGGLAGLAALGRAAPARRRPGVLQPAAALYTGRRQSSCGHRGRLRLRLRKRVDRARAGRYARGRRGRKGGRAASARRARALVAGGTGMAARGADARPRRRDVVHRAAARPRAL